MNAKHIVLSRYPVAVATCVKGDTPELSGYDPKRWFIESGESAGELDCDILGEGATEAAAWRDAAEKLQAATPQAPA